ncbi:sialidase family protein [Dyadobacter pollutisoli]|jgi:sialidase-1|uniref:exo-alpha-sialidase n=1 Tax=Dyadobacter pollutisoli TaxID=2910158 RepID=A0A9E8NED4_9BACT|nr:sialidase family protein [Dyadobacter pollutisoli]WAC13001.1 sialidase family protein [Dyadobacter pollutisoli]
MKTLKYLLVINLLAVRLLASGQTPVFVSGTEGYKSFRIPAIISAQNGELLAFAEGRVGGSGDFGDIDIVMKRSKDKGKTWSKIQVVATYENLQAGNPAPVMDLTDPAFANGRLFLFFNTGNNHEGEVRKGKGLREVWYKTSTDGGLTWQQPVNITTQVHRPKQPQTNAAYNFEQDWRSYANTPGHGMQLLEGRYKGRIYIAANHSAGEPKSKFTDYQAHGFYSDDHGKTFKLSETISIEGSNESTAAEISGGRLMFNSRNQKGDVRARIVAISSDGGASWDTTYFEHNLPDPVCEGSILSIGKNKGKNMLAFSNAADTKNRDNLTLRISFDDGRTWTRQYLVDQSKNGEKDYTAYSDLVKTGKNNIGILYELDGYKSIVFKEINWKR